MTIRLATDADLTAIVDMGAKFHAASGEHVPYCRESAEASARSVMGMGFILIAEFEGEPIGMLGIVIAPMFFNFAVTFAQELMWWVDTDARGSGAAMRLIREAEGEARDRGASRIHMLRLPNSPAHVASIYDRLGYTTGEVAHVKEL